jgi:hypothetical protein
LTFYVFDSLPLLAPLNPLSHLNTLEDNHLNGLVVFHLKVFLLSRSMQSLLWGARQTCRRLKDRKLDVTDTGDLVLILVIMDTIIGLLLGPNLCESPLAQTPGTTGQLIETDTMQGDMSQWEPVDHSLDNRISGIKTRLGTKAIESDTCSVWMMKMSQYNSVATEISFHADDFNRTFCQ